jgi:predicted Zn-dependent protease
MWLERWTMRGWKRFIHAQVQWADDLLWLAGRPKLIVEWYRMWGTTPSVCWLRAADAFINKDFKRAVGYYERGLAQKPAHVARHCAVMDLAYCRYRTGDLEGAATELQKLTAESVALRDAYLLLAKINDILGKPDQSLQVLGDGLLLFPQDLKLMLAYMHTSLFYGLFHSRLGEVREQVLQIKRGLMLDDERQVFIDAALAHYELRCGDAECAERMIVRVLATGKAPHEIVILRGERLFEQRRVIQAREQLGRAMRLAPRNPRPVRLLAESYLLSGDFQEPEWAEQLATVACRLTNWKNIECLELLSRAYDEKGDTSTAELLSEKVREVRMTVELERVQLESPSGHVRALGEVRLRSDKMEM